MEVTMKSVRHPVELSTGVLRSSGWVWLDKKVKKRSSSEKKVRCEM